MSEEAAARGGASAGEPARPPGDPSHGQPSPEPGKGRKRGPSRSIVITIIGALITAGILTATLVPGLIGAKPSGPAGDAEPSLSPLAPIEIAAAMPTLDPATSKAAVDDAKNCKAPLARV